MQQHPAYVELSKFLPKYPRAAGALFQTYNDLKLGECAVRHVKIARSNVGAIAQQWTGIEVVDLTSCSRAALRGRRPKSDDILLVIPCSLSESLSIAWLHEAFRELGGPPQIYLAINTDDSSIVYYKISSGIVKPPV
ncbi:tRNA intron endonuclease [Fomitopsis betulina]|nr:tRNA intron endonuclease [Fomitopsis betulina]